MGRGLYDGRPSEPEIPGLGESALSTRRWQGNRAFADGWRSLGAGAAHDRRRLAPVSGLGPRYACTGWCLSHGGRSLLSGFSARSSTESGPGPPMKSATSPAR